MAEEDLKQSNISGESDLFSDASEESGAGAPVADPGVRQDAGESAPETSNDEASAQEAALSESEPSESAPESSSAEDADAASAKKPAVPGAVTEDDVRAKIHGLPGKWYVLQTYSGYEKRVKQDLGVRVNSMNMEDYIYQVEVPMEEAFQVSRGQRKLVSRVRMPGYVLVRMEMTDESWRVVQNTNGVTGFVGNGRDPVSLREDEVVTMLTPIVEQEAAEEARAAGAPVGTQPATLSPFSVGDAVTLVTEPWAGMPATVSQIDAENQRLTVTMTLVGQEMPVELGFSQVRKED